MKASTGTSVSSASRLQRAAPVLLLAAAVIAFGSGVFTYRNGFVSDDSYRSHDWLIAATHEAMFRNTVLGYHQLPLRSHLVGGGYPVAAHPSDGSYSPFALTSLVFGERIGLRLNLIIALFLGALGVFLLGRDVFGFTLNGALFAGCAFAFAGWHPSRILVGYYESTLFLLFPLMLYLIITARQSFARFFLAVVLTTTCFLQVLGGAAVFALWAAAHLGWGVRSPEFTLRRRTGLAYLVLVLAAAMLLGAIKFVPMAELLRRGSSEQHLPPALQGGVPADPLARFLQKRTGGYYRAHYDPRSDPAGDMFYRGWRPLLASLVEPVALQGQYRPIGQGRVAPISFEYRAIAVGYLALALAGVVLCWRRLGRSIFVLLLFVWICLGPYAPLNLHRVVNLLPVINSFNRPVQYFNFVIYVELVVLAGGALSWIESRLRHRRLLLTAAFVLLLPSALVNVQRYERAFSRTLPEYELEGVFYQVKLANPELREQAATGYGNTYLNVTRGLGSIVWDNNIMLPENARPRFLVTAAGELIPADGYYGEAYFADDTNQVWDIVFSPNKLAMCVKVPKAGTLTVNQNYDPAWVSTVGHVVDAGGLLGVELPPTLGKIELRYRPAAPRTGALISLSSLAALGLVGWWRRRKKCIAS